MNQREPQYRATRNLFAIAQAGAFRLPAAVMAADRAEKVIDERTEANATAERGAGGNLANQLAEQLVQLATTGSAWPSDIASRIADAEQLERRLNIEKSVLYAAGELARAE